MDEKLQKEINPVKPASKSAITKGVLELNGVLLAGIWMLALSLVLLAGYIAWRVQSTQAAFPVESPTLTPQTPSLASASNQNSAELPGFLMVLSEEGIIRRTAFHTNIPTRPRTKVIEYSVTIGDSVFGIAQSFNLHPETILWANYDQLNDSPDMLNPGMKLNVPPVDGVYYQWQDGDTFESVSAKFDAKADEILGWEGNNFDLTNPQVEPDEWIMIPNGHREFRQWLVPTIARSNSGVSKSLLGPGACEGNYTGAYGSGAFAWPTASHTLSGNDFWSGHLGIDIAGSLGDGVFASDAGVIVFAGWANGGYGYMVMIDHGNGYQTLYAHLSAVSAACGLSVYTGTYIGAVGSTGNSTGPHLHFEVRYLGGFISPWYVLPPP
ncbi:MAG: LysM peptidoglycan-binding domain-containing M23 family metallopeptidase [Anaerolineales bacterium]|jgi:murein DD-endopeptidase MepM/ murein hydrolase activator NlpD